MADLIDTLRQLQALDAELFRLRRDQQQRPLALEQATQQVAEQQANAKAIEARRAGLQVKHKEKELELSTREANVKKLQMQRFQVKTNKEYSAIQHEIDQAKGDISLFEEEILRVLDAIDQTAREHAGQLARVAKEQEALRAHETRVQQELKAIEEQIRALEDRRSALTPLVERDALSLYERVLVNRDGLAMVPLVKESCGGCNMVQPPQVINEVYLKAKLVTCDSCNRVLYVDQNV